MSLVLTPDDDFNRVLLGHVHPADWPQPVPGGRYNLVAIGGGTAGLISAMATAGLGGRAALIESHLLGGDCLNFGCVPSKALLAAAHRAQAARDGVRLGVCARDVAVDFAAVMARLRQVRAHISHHDSAARFRDAGVDVFLGAACLTGKDSLSVNGTELRFKRCVIATGARAFVPPIPGLERVDALTNETVFSLTELPGRLAVIGAGPIGCELAQAFVRFGSEVHVIDVAERILGKDDPDAAAIVQRRMVKDGVAFHLGTGIEAVARVGADIHIQLGGGRAPIVCDRVLVATGRRPNVDGLGLDAAGVEATRAGVVVDDRLRTRNRRIYAAGDVCSSLQFTHAADAMARIVVQNALFFGRKRVSDLVVPWCTYTDPEVAHVGVPVGALASRGLKRVHVPLSDIDRAVCDGDDEGFARFHVDGKGRIHAATIVARNAGDMISEVCLAMTHGIGLGGIASTIHPYPTQAEVIKRAADAHNRARLTPWVAKLLAWVLRWRR